MTLLQRAGFEVVVPPAQTCCGQPAYNAGARESAQKLARQTIDILSPFEHVVIPSGSCAGMIIKQLTAAQMTEGDRMVREFAPKKKF